MKKVLVVNLFGGPSVGKSTVAAGIFYYLKRMQYNVELVTEFAKELVWEQHDNMLDDQTMIFAQQQRKMNRLCGKVDIIVTDSPLLLAILYANKNTYKSLFHLIHETWESYENISIVLDRNTTYDPVGRMQDEQSAITKDKEIEELLHSKNIAFTKISPNKYHDVSIHIVDTIIRPLFNKEI